MTADQRHQQDILFALGELKGLATQLCLRLDRLDAHLLRVETRLTALETRVGGLENRVTKLEERVHHWRPISLATSAASGLGGGGLVNAIISFFT